MNLSTSKNKITLIILSGIALLFIVFIIASINKPTSATEVSGNDASNDEIAFFDASQPEEDATKAYHRLLQSIICEELDTAAVAKYFITENVRSYTYQSFIDFYKTRHCKPAWNTINGPLPQADSLLTALQSAPEEGLHYDYHLEDLSDAKREVRQSLSGTTWPDSVQLAKIAHLDFLMTASYLTYASHLLSGKVDPEQFDITWRAEPRKRNLAPVLEKALRENNISQSLQHVAPPHTLYEQLKNKLIQYQTIATQGGWPAVPAGTTLKPGDVGSHIGLLKQRLFLTNDYPALTAQDSIPIYNDLVADAVKNFQRRNGLRADGIAGKNTLALLNIPVEKRIEKIRINLERLRWLPDTLGQHYVRVNIPDYKASVIENGQPVLSMKAVVGKEFTSTPVFRDEIQYLEFSPTWTVPLSIARRNILPKLKKDPGYLTRNNFLLYENWQSDSSLLDPSQIDWSAMAEDDFHYRLVQQPGPNNALGQVKFMFPNDLAIYLHDTPKGNLFDKKNRAYSNGCVRVEKPVELALHLLQDVPDVNRDNISDFMHLTEPKVVSLPKPVPIQFMYLTAFVNEEGSLNFRKDIYGHDSLQIEAIQ